MAQYLFFIIIFALFLINCISADGVSIITQPIPIKIDQIVLQTDQELFISSFNNLEIELNEANTVFLELTELANEWEGAAEWTNGSDEEVLLISDYHGEEIIFGPNNVISNAEKLDAVTVVTGAAIAEAINSTTNNIDNAENEVNNAVENIEDAANNASENIQGAYNNATGDIHEAANEIGDNIQDDYNNVVNNATENVSDHITDNINDAANSVTEYINDVGYTISSWFGSNN